MKKRKCIMKNMETGAEDKNQQTTIYVMTHKAFTPPPVVYSTSCGTSGGFVIQQG